MVGEGFLDNLCIELMVVPGLYSKDFNGGTILKNEGMNSKDLFVLFNCFFFSCNCYMLIIFLPIKETNKKWVFLTHHH